MYIYYNPFTKKAIALKDFNLDVEEKMLLEGGKYLWAYSSYSTTLKKRALLSEEEAICQRLDNRVYSLWEFKVTPEYMELIKVFYPALK